MVDQKIIDYFKQNGSQYPTDQLKKTLIGQGYSENDVNEAAAQAGYGLSSGPLQPQQASQGSSDMNNFFDKQTTDTILHCIIGMIIAQIFIFVLEGIFIRYGIANIAALGIASIFVIIFSVIGGFISGILISKLYYIVMDFISINFKFLLPITNTFFKLLFVPVLIGSIISLLWGLFLSMTAAAVITSMAGASGLAMGGLIGGSIILSTIWSIIVTIIGRFIFAKYMAMQVGKYYHDYKQK